jgi:hypothetical protein
MKPGEDGKKTWHDRDVLMYVKSETVIRRVLPPNAQDEGIRAFQEYGHLTYYAPIGQTGGHSGFVGSTVFDSGRFGNKPILDKELTEEEADAVQLVWKVAHEKGRTIHIVDVGKESALRRLIEEHRHHLHRFPVLIRPDGRRLEDVHNFSEESLERFLAD